tara:strand:+ start:1528 stop:2067 length:540 start_codon:yes stop_codon:yes gene_type:complete
MNKPHDVDVIGNFDVSNIQSYINNNKIDYNDKYDDLYNRKPFFEGVFTHFIINLFKDVNYYSYVNFTLMISELMPILYKKYGKGRVFRMQLSNMRGGAQIKPHVDSGLQFVFSHRIHIPIFTNDSVDFFVDDNKFNLECGKIYEINNKKKHSVINHNPDDHHRIHLIIDYVENQYCPFV